MVKISSKEVLETAIVETRNLRDGDEVKHSTYSMDNHTTGTEFIILGLSSDPHLQTLLFIVFLWVYLITMFGNLAIILAIRVDPHLHTPMYVFLSHLALFDIVFSNVTIPKMLESFLTGQKAISLHSCFTQAFFVVYCCAGEGFLLAVMAYDRYVAICHPLHYTVMMSTGVTSLLLCGTHITSILSAVLDISLLTTLDFCGPNIIHHFCCELPQLFKLSCSNTFANHLVILTLGFTLAAGAILITFGSYVFILSAVLRINSREGKRKAFSTCSSHLTIVVLYYGTILFRYLKPASQDFQDQEMAPSIVYFVVTPMLNPIIYSLRNQEMKRTLINIWHGKLKRENPCFS
ncbi:olfactory receptor 5AR1-like [Tiliqua scincoides]|uniref:olfactory receptor 5AR1-like n=1 Tax=Tiliqua scincoides TaxID=71010 RepID=UPI003462EEB5